MLVAVGADRNSVEEVEVSAEWVESLDLAAAGSKSAVPAADNKGSSADYLTVLSRRETI